MVLVKEKPEYNLVGFFFHPKPGDAERIETAKEVNNIKFSTCRFSRIEDTSKYPCECTFYDQRSLSSHSVGLCYLCTEYIFTPKTKI